MFQPVKAIAHRGYSAHYPENTLEAYARAFEAGAFAVEVDVRLSAGHVPVCIHDATLDRLAGEAISVAQCTVRELRRKMAPAYKLCPLKDVFAFCAEHPDRRLLLDIKGDILPPVFALIRDFSLQDRITVGVRTLEQAVVLRRLDSQIPVLGFFSDYEQFSVLLNDPKAYPRFWEEDLLGNPALLKLAQGRACWITAGSPQAEKCGNTDRDKLQQLEALGVYAVLANDPAFIVANTTTLKARDITAHLHP